MKRTRRNNNYLDSSESDNEKSVKKSSPSNDTLNILKHSYESSSESDIEDYLLKPEKLDFDSNFFNTNLSEFEKIKKKNLSGVTELSDSESEIQEETANEQIQSQNAKTSVTKSHSGSSSKMNFKQLQDYTKKIEEAKTYIEIYKAKKQAGENTDILNLLTAGEGKLGTSQTFKPIDLHSSDFESCESEQEDWEEIKIKSSQENKQKNILPERSLQITVNIPDNVKKKKGVDLLAAVKRRLNRIRKENQVFVHKVHLLCWLAHGNYVNSSINDTETLARALSLLPSQQCYPSDRVDLSYLEQIVNWYKRSVKNIEKPVPEGISLEKFLQLQISKKEAYNKKMLAFIFIAILRALGCQTRLVMSLQVEPIRPPLSELHTVSTKPNERQEKNNKNVGNTKGTNKANILKQASTKPNEKDQKSNKNAGNTKANILKQAQYVDIKPTTKKILKQENKFNEVVNSKAVSSKSKSNLSHETTSKKKSSRSKNTYSVDGIDKDILKTVQKLTNIIGNEMVTNNKTLDPTSKMREAKKHSKDTESKNLELPIKKSQNKKKSVDTRAPETKDSVQGDGSQQWRKETKIKMPKCISQKEKTVESNLPIQKTKSRTKSAKNKESVATVESNIKPSKSVENVSNTRVLRTKPKKSIPQLDGVYDSDTNLETIVLQVDGGNDKRKQSKSNVSSDVKVSKKSSRSRCANTKSSSEVYESDSESEFESTSRSPINKKGLTSTVNVKKLTNKLLSSSKKEIDVRNDVINIVKGRISQQRKENQSRLATKRKQDLDSESDSDYAPKSIKMKYHNSDDDFVPKTKVKRRVQIHGKSVLSDTENEVEKNKKKGNDVWVEVFLEAEEKWISVDVIYGQVHCIKEISQRATHPVSYVISWDNNNKIKDVTQRYCPNFNTVTRKQRVDEKWWNDSLKPFMGTPTTRDKEEDDDLARQQLDQPLPKAISEYKNHPFYALRRHLLKFEALYPPEPATLGFIRGEAVYPRSVVYTLHSRDIWLKQAKVVKLGEQPYKIVKGRPKYDRLSNKVLSGQDLEIFGIWQVQDYEPPIAENGIVPKNAFGNVDLFKPCMLPKGCVHLKLPGLNKIARKMNIDIASAIVGFDFHGGWSHPVYDGYVVCQEYEDQLICIWELEQDELDRKEEEKINKRVYGNWKKLIKGLLIRERLNAKYDFGEPSTSNIQVKKNKGKSTR